MEAITQVENKSNYSRIEEIISKAEKRDIQPIDIVDVSELKIDVSGTIGTLIDETIGSDGSSEIIKNKGLDLKMLSRGLITI